LSQCEITFDTSAKLRRHIRVTTSKFLSRTAMLDRSLPPVPSFDYALCSANSKKFHDKDQATDFAGPLLPQLIK
jgi:hypothetical protein